MYRSNILKIQPLGYMWKDDERLLMYVVLSVLKKCFSKGRRDWNKGHRSVFDGYCQLQLVHVPVKLNFAEG